MQLCNSFMDCRQEVSMLFIWLCRIVGQLVGRPHSVVWRLKYIFVCVYLSLSVIYLCGKSHILYLRSEGKGDPNCECCRAHRWGWNVPSVDTQEDTRRKWTGPHCTRHPPPPRSWKALGQGTPAVRRLKGKKSKHFSLFISAFVSPKVTLSQSNLTTWQQHNPPHIT